MKSVIFGCICIRSVVDSAEHVLSLYHVRWQWHEREELDAVSDEVEILHVVG
jgi:hypothetical protein